MAHQVLLLLRSPDVVGLGHLIQQAEWQLATDVMRLCILNMRGVPSTVSRLENAQRLLSAGKKKKTNKQKKKNIALGKGDLLRLQDSQAVLSLLNPLSPGSACAG